MRIARRNVKRAGLLCALIASGALLLAMAAPASAAVGPQWRIDAYSNSTVAPGGIHTFLVQLTNAGDQAMNGTDEVQVRAELPPGMVAKTALLRDLTSFAEPECEDASDGSEVDGAQEIVCKHNEPVPASKEVTSNFEKLTLTAEAQPGAEGTLTAKFEVSGGGAPTVKSADTLTISETPPPFGFEAFDSMLAEDAAGTAATQAGGHPYDYATSIEFNTAQGSQPIEGSPFPIEPPRNLFVELPPGLVGNPTIAATCSAGELAGNGGFGGKTFCPPASQVGTQLVRLKGTNLGTDPQGPFPLFNMEPPPGTAARFGFNVLGTLVFIDAKLRQVGDYGLTAVSTNIPEALGLAGSTTTFWGVPASEDHRLERACPIVEVPANGGPTCESPAAEEPFFRLPTACPNPGVGLETAARMDSWFDPGDFDEASSVSHEAPGFPFQPDEWGAEKGIEGCEKVPVEGELDARPTSRDTETSSGLNVHVEVPNPGLDNPEGIASSDLKKVKVALSRGVTINPSQAEGLGVCSPAQYESTELSFHPTSKGCPEDSKIGTVEVKTPLLHETIPGNVYIAQQDDPTTPQPGAENPFDSLLALYIVLAEPQRGILVKLPGKVDLEDPAHPGQIVTTFEDLPQLPFSTFDFKFREGARAPLVTPPTCGNYTTETEITGHSDPGNPITSTSSFTIDRGIGGGPCPSGAPGFNPGFSAGSLNNNAGAYSPFLMRLTRNDGEQNLTKFSSILPPGVSAKIAGVEKCSEPGIASAKGKSGRQELSSPSCPAGSQIGRSLAGAGVGSVLTYVPGKIYLAGPWNGAPLSVVAITPAVAGPFDVGTVVVREALTLDPVTAEVHVDGEKSDPIPHILKGIPLKLRDLQVFVDRSKFTINPTSCDPSQVKATLFGSSLDVFDPADDVPVDLASRFQAANCARLGFKPNLKINLKGGTKRGGHPALRALFRPRTGDANLARTVVKLPRSAFLDQAHIRTICTRVQFAADACPKAAIYGKVTAFTPLLDEPLKGPAYLRSSDNKLPDLVFDLHGVVDVETSARIDSVRGGIRATFPFIPDAPLSKVIVEMQGGAKGLIVNSRNLCNSRSRAEVALDGHNGKLSDSRPVVKPDCGARSRRNRTHKNNREDYQ